MKRILLIVAGILLLASLAFAQAGKIQVYADPGLNGCDLTDVGVFQVYVYHINTSGATASQFSIVPGGGAAVSFLGQTSPFPNVIGQAHTGVAVAYGSCRGGNGPVELLSCTYVGSGISPPCSYLEVTDDPTALPPGLYVTDCRLVPQLLIGDGSQAIFNSDGSCDCIPPVPVEETSWGKIKALYQ